MQVQADRVSVELQVEKLNKYLKDLAVSESAFADTQNSMADVSSKTQKMMERAREADARSAKKSQATIAKATKSMTNAIRSGAVEQSAATSKGVDKIKRKYKEQIDAQKTVEDSSRRLGKAIKSALGPIAVAGATAGAAAYIKSSLEVAQVIEQQSKIAGVSAERFQELTYASDRHGISQEKLADILKDTQDKFGDYYNTGAGPLADFFDTIAPKVGLTAENFRDLSSDQALGLFVKALEDVGANDQDVTFFMEALASDAKALLPLFRDNASELNGLTTEVREFGKVLDNDAVAKAAEANRTLDKLGDAISGNLRGAVIELAPEIEELTEDIIGFLPTLVAWTKNVSDLFSTIGDGVERVSRAWNLSPFGKGEAFFGDPTNLAEVERRLEAIVALNQHHQKVLAENGTFMDRLTRSTAESDFDSVGMEIFGKERFEQMKKDGVDFRKAIEDEYNRTADLIETFQRDATSPFKIEGLMGGAGDKRGNRRSLPVSSKAQAEQRILDARIKTELDAIRKLGQTELEQIEMLRQERLATIDQAKIADTEKAELRAKVERDAAAEIKKVNDDLAAQEAKRAESLREAKRDELDFIAQIAAANARMNGRALEATQIELEARRARYQAEIVEIEALIAKRKQAGLDTSEQDAALAGAQAGLAGVDQSEAEFRKRTLDSIQGISGGAEKDGLSAELARLEEEKQAKIELANEYRSQDVEFERAYKAELLEIEEEYEEKRKQAKIASYRAQFDAAAGVASDIGEALRTAGREGTKAAKIAAKAQQGIALGRATMNGALAISEAVASAPFPLNLPAIAFATAVNGAQVAAIAAATFKDGGVNIMGPGTSRSDSIPARISRGESVITADATRGNEAGLRRLNAGLPPEQAFGLSVPGMPDVGVPTLMPAPSNVIQMGDMHMSVGDNADFGTVEALRQELTSFRRSFVSDVNTVMDAREKRRVPRSQRSVGGR